MYLVTNPKLKYKQNLNALCKEMIMNKFSYWVHWIWILRWSHKKFHWLGMGHLPSQINNVPSMAEDHNLAHMQEFLLDKAQIQLHWVSLLLDGTPGKALIFVQHLRDLSRHSKIKITSFTRFPRQTIKNNLLLYLTLRQHSLQKNY